MEHKDPIMHEKSTFEVIETQNHQQQQQQQQQEQEQEQEQQKQQEREQKQEQEQQQQQRRVVEGKNVLEQRKTKETHESISYNNNGGKDEEENGVLGPRERLKRHRKEVAGQVWIPDMWGQEDFLKDWIDCTSFDASLVPQNTIMLARASLMQEGRRSTSNTLTIENSC